MLAVRQVAVSFGKTAVLRGIDLQAVSGEIICLLGPSGCGKTTLLRVIAGLEKPQQGEVWFDNQLITNIPIHQRNFGLMFQDFALFPHMNVAKNVAFGLKMQHVSPAEQQRRVHEVLELVGLAELENRDVSRLSGGERQRVALARSLAPNPRLLMLDEPLGSLDAALRERLVVELRDIIKRVGLTAVYVTHDQHEAFAIADRIAIMNAGLIEQIGTPETIYRQPSSVFATRFLGLNNIVPVLHQTDGKAQTALGDFLVAGPADALLLHPDGLKRVEPDAPGALAGTVEECVFQGDSYRLQLRLQSDLIFTLKVPSHATPSPRPGDTIAVCPQPNTILPLVNTPQL
ncbi:MAG TPA: ABC transporter ATP-binding protein [Phototrophicaceae bacterium]|nr:ABC transporter ATP-binding protein [Phototrophicaceae bacterium]